VSGKREVTPREGDVGVQQGGDPEGVAPGGFNLLREGFEREEICAKARVCGKLADPA